MITEEKIQAVKKQLTKGIPAGELRAQLKQMVIQQKTLSNVSVDIRLICVPGTWSLGLSFSSQDCGGSLKMEVYYCLSFP